MKNLKSPFVLLFTILAVACFHISVWGQSADDKKLANLTASGLGVRWDVAVPHAGLTITVSTPDGQVLRKEVKEGGTAEFRLTDSQGERLADGQYTYELRLAPILSASVKETLANARAKGNDAEVARDLRKKGLVPAQSLVQSGGFLILNGSVIVPGSLQEPGVRSVGKVTEPARTPAPATGPAFSRSLLHHVRSTLMPDFVIADDLIVQGSACVGLDCVDGENFGFDTIRMKENNTRLQYDDTSTSAGFATNNWQIRANSSASGGGSFLGIVDQGATGNSESGTIIAQFDAGSPANSLRLSSSGNLGLGTATPVLDVHANTTDTPAIRLEQNNSGGFTAQTWDIAGNEANFFVRDVTSGSRLPFRIRPGAPTSSIDIAASGNVGIGTGSPGTTLDIFGNTTTLGSDSGATTRTNNTTKLNRFVMPPFTSTNLNFAVIAGATTNADNLVGVGGGAGGFSAATVIFFNTAATTNTDTGTERMRITSSGNVGIGTAVPTQTLSVNGTAGKSGGGTWDVFSDERLKKIKGPFNTGLKAVMQLQPIRYEYKPNNALGIKSEGEHVGFGAQSLQRIIPEAVSSTDSGYLMVKSDPIIWSMLNAIKEQQKQIEQLKTEVRRLKATSRRRR
jgi:endosialidase-like protein